MTYTLTLSSQGQVVIPSQVRKLWGAKGNRKLTLNIDPHHPLIAGTIHPQPKSWIKTAMGLGKGIWGKGEVYVKKERKTWDK